jgi:hypothetical protein
MFWPRRPSNISVGIYITIIAHDLLQNVLMYAEIAISAYTSI